MNLTIRSGSDDFSEFPCNIPPATKPPQLLKLIGGWKGAQKHVCLTLPDGSPLDTSRGLADQGVSNGFVLVVSPKSNAAPKLSLVNCIEGKIDGKLLVSNTLVVSIQPLVHLVVLQPLLVHELIIRLKKHSNGAPFKHCHQESPIERHFLFQLNGNHFLDYNQEYSLEVRCREHELLNGSPPGYSVRFTTGPPPSLGLCPSTGATTAAAPTTGTATNLSYADLRLWTNNFERGDGNANDRVTGFLDEGSFGRVFKGLATQLTFQEVYNRRDPQDTLVDIPAQRIVVKQLRISRQYRVEVSHLAASMQRELNVLSKPAFQHDNIVRLLGAVVNPPLLKSRVSNSFHHEEMLDELGIYPCLVYEYLDLGSLESHLCNDKLAKMLTWRRRFRIMLGVARGLHHLHTALEDQPAFHRDIKPANIGLTFDYIAKLIDYGLAKFHPADGGGVQSHTSMGPLGSRAYLCPVYWNNKVYNERCDIFSFGIVLLEVLCGRTQTKLIEQRGTIYQHIRGEIQADDPHFADRRCGELPADLVKAWKDIAVRCIDDSPQNRYASMQEVIDLFQTLEAQYTATTTLSIADEESAELRQQLHSSRLNRDILLRANYMRGLYESEHEWSQEQQCRMPDCRRLHTITRPDEGIICSVKRHFCCKDCVNQSVEAMLTDQDHTEFLRQHHFTIFCPLCRIKDPLALHAFDEQDVSRQLQPTIFRELRKQHHEWLSRLRASGTTRATSQEIDAAPEMPLPRQGEVEDHKDDDDDDYVNVDGNS